MADENKRYCTIKLQADDTTIQIRQWLTKTEFNFLRKIAQRINDFSDKPVLFVVDIVNRQLDFEEEL